MNIITITLNPAFDVHCTAERFEAGHENLALITEREAGGKGVNISRALALNGIPNMALLAVGDENGDDFCRELDKDSITYETITLHGRIRENITVHTKNAPETRISFCGFETDETLLCEFKDRISKKLEDGDIVTFTGRVPSGISMKAVKGFIGDLKNMGAKVVIDSRSFTKDDLIETAPWLIKPNEEEVSVYLEREINNFDDVTEGARELYRSGIENVMVSLGAKGALLVSRDGTFVAYPPKIEALSTIGAGDSSIGGFLAAAYEGKNYENMLKTAVSYGSAACMSSGTRPPRPEDVAEIFSHIVVKKIKIF